MEAGDETSRHRLALAAGADAAGWRGAALAAPRTDIVVGMQLEPPHPRPDRGRGGGDRRGRLRQRLRGADPLRAGRRDRCRRWPRAGRSRPTGSPGSSTCTTGVKFHDGTPFTAEDVVFSFDRAMAEGFDQRPEAALRRHQRGDRDRRRHRRDRRSTQPKGVAALQSRLGRRGDRLAGDAPTATRRSRSAPGRSSSRTGCRATAIELVQEPRLLGRRRRSSTR